MGDTDYIDMRSLVRKMIEGEIQLNKPITLTSKDRTGSEQVSFLSHILKYNGVTKQTIFIFLNETLEIFNNQILKLMRDPNAQKFIDNVKKEWSDTSDILFKYEISQEKVVLIENVLENINKLCKEFKQLTKKLDSNDVTDTLVEDELMDDISKFTGSVEEFNKNVEEITKDLNDYSNELDKINIGLLLDLSMKDKSLYLQFNDVNKDDKISENIHNIFLNYSLILNLVKKHLIYYKNIIDKVTEIASKMNNFTINKKKEVKKSDTVFQVKEQEKGIEKYLERLSN